MEIQRYGPSRGGILKPRSSPITTNMSLIKPSRYQIPLSTLQNIPNTRLQITWSSVGTAYVWSAAACKKKWRSIRPPRTEELLFMILISTYKANSLETSLPPVKGTILPPSSSTPNYHKGQAPPSII